MARSGQFPHSACCNDLRKPAGNGAANRIGVIFLQIMRSRPKIDEPAVLQTGREFARSLRRDQCAGIASKQEFRVGRQSQRAMVVLADGGNVGGLALDRQFPG